MNSIQEHKIIKTLFSKLLKQKQKQFPAPRQSIDAPHLQGVYIIYSPKNVTLHVGRTLRGKKGIAQRLRNHLDSKSSFSEQFLDSHGKRLRSGYKFRCLALKNARKRALLESYATGRLCPAHIGLGESRS